LKGVEQILKNIMKKIFLAACIVIASFSFQQLNAQTLGSSYKTAIGAKGYFGDGSIGGFNIKHFLTASNALEGSLLFKKHIFAVEGVYEWHGPIAGAPGLKWYVGPGAQLGFYDRDYYNDATYFAVKGALGLDIKFRGAPINMAFDINPVFTLTPDTDFNFNAGLAFRFAF
jgi:hypothetical protein